MTANWLEIRLRPRGPFHLGERGVGLEETAELIHSDTLFGALCWAWTLYYGSDLSTFLRPFQAGDPPFLISSAFPYAGGVHLVPRPEAGISVAGDEERAYRIVKADWISLSLLIEAARGPIPGDRMISVWEESAFLLQEDQAMLPESLKGDPGSRPWTIARLPRVTLDRVSHSSEIFHSGALQFAPDCGLYLWAQLRSPQAKEELETLFRLLADEGLGGERSCGYGQFQPTFTEVKLPPPLVQREVGAWLLLSLYNPDARELETLDLRRSAYTLIRRRSWVCSPQARALQTAALSYFAEGSVIALKDGASPQGRLVEVLPVRPGIPHSVYRNGLAFAIPWCVPEED
jgi:CRISPR-associated protein Csm4